MQSKAVCAFLLFAALAGAVVLSFAQNQPAKPALTAAHAADVASRDSIVAALYESISGPAGTRDWDRFRALFIPEAQLIAAFKKKDATVGYKAVSVQGYIDGADKYFKEHGFYEREVSRKLESFGNIAHVFSTYESRETRDGKPFERGINSILLLNDGFRWWVVTVYWEGERPDNPIPPRYLTNSDP